MPCLFHFIQALWRKAGQESLRKKNVISATSELMTVLILLAFLDPSNLHKIFKKIEAHFNQIYKDLFKSFLSYFEQQWLYQIDPKIWNFYVEIVQDFAKVKRTNNCIESFHAQLSKQIKKV